VIHDLETGALIRHGRAPHPDSSEADPDIWWSALGQAIEAAGGIDDVHGVAIAAQHLRCSGMIRVAPKLPTIWWPMGCGGAGVDLVRRYR
jgi:hypothetical protein